MTELLDALQGELTTSAQNSMDGSWHYFAATHKLLYADTERCGKYFKQARKAIAERPESQSPTEALELYAHCDFWYRTLLRAFCTEIEGTVCTMREIIVWAKAREEVVLNSDEDESIKEKNYWYKLSAKHKFKLVFALFPRVFASSFKVNYNDNGWKCLQAVMDARNRFTHPIGLCGRFSAVPGNDYNVLLEAMRWFYGLWEGMARSMPEYSKTIDGGA